MNEQSMNLRLGQLSVDRSKAAQELDHRTGKLRDAVQEAADAGMAEAAIARAALLTRATIRDWLGKPRRGQIVRALAYDNSEILEGPYVPRTDCPGAVPPADAAWVDTGDAQGPWMVKASTVEVVGSGS